MNSSGSALSGCRKPIRQACSAIRFSPAAASCRLRAKSPYFSSPRMGNPRCARCTRIWCVRPVFSCASSRLIPGQLAGGTPYARACLTHPRAPVVRRYPASLPVQRQTHVLDSIHPAPPDQYQITFIRVTHALQKLRRARPSTLNVSCPPAGFPMFPGRGDAPVRETWPAVTRRRASITPKLTPLPPMHRHALGFIHHQQGIILEQKRQLDPLLGGRNHLSHRPLRQPQRWQTQDITGLQTIGCGHPPPCSHALHHYAGCGRHDSSAHPCNAGTKSYPGAGLQHLSTVRC